MSATIYIVDTNFFIQCRNADELDWTLVSDSEEIHLVVSSPVLREIDFQKNRGGDRVGKQARKTHSVFREILVSSVDHKVMREKGTPIVKLILAPEWEPSEDFANRLNYDKADDELVGCLASYLKEHPEASVSLLTHDAGPMATAKRLKLPFTPIPDNWLSPPESTASEKKLLKLQQEVVRLQKTEPTFQIHFRNKQSTNAGVLEYEHLVYEPLTESEVLSLLAVITDRFPIESDFGSSEPEERSVETAPFNFAGVTKAFTPASAEAITKYTEEDYPAWFEKCEALLRNLHVSSQKSSTPLTFTVAASNSGTRPGIDALITVQVQGEFQIRSKEDDEEEPNIAVEFPKAPKAPKGRWKTGVGGHFFDPSGALSKLHSAFQMHEGRSSASDSSLFLSKMPPRRRDANAFYWKPSRTSVPSDSVSLECEQWRHDDADEEFDFELVASQEPGAKNGLVKVSIKAANLSDSARANIPVKIAVRKVSSFERATALLESFLKG